MKRPKLAPYPADWHPAVVCSGVQLDRIIEELEAGTYPQPDNAIWRGDLPRDLAVRLARATGADDDQIAEILQLHEWVPVGPGYQTVTGLRCFMFARAAVFAADPGEALTLAAAYGLLDPPSGPDQAWLWAKGPPEELPG